MSTSISDSFGLTPAHVKWNVVRGDTSELFVEFLENDESTVYDISEWEFSSSAYDFKGDVLDELDVVPSAEGVTIIAQSDITEYWGAGYNSTVAELAFDLQVIVNNKVWTPIIGTIKVQADVTGGL